MGGRLLDWLGQGAAASRPTPAAMAALLGTTNSVALYYANDTQILGILDQNAGAWFDIDVPAVASLSFSTMPDVDWTTPPTEGQLFLWDNTAAKLEPCSLVDGTGIDVVIDMVTRTVTINSTITQYTDELAQDAIGAAFAAGTHTGISVTYNDGTNSFDLAVSAGFVEGLADARIATLAPGIADAQIAAASIGDLSDVDHTTPPAAGQVPTWNGTDYAPATPSGLPSGTVFPGSPADGDLFYRTDRKIEYFYSSAAAKWLSRHLYEMKINWCNGATADGIADRIAIPHRGTYTLWLETLQVFSYQSAAAEWRWTLRWVSLTNTFTNIAYISTLGDTAANWYDKTLAIDSEFDAVTLGAYGWEWNVDEISGAAQLFGGALLYYRLVG